jgi:hypothetical protein
MYIRQVTALMNNDYPVLSALLEAGADPTLDSGEAPFQKPVYEIALRLVMCGAPNADLEDIDHIEELTALHIAVPEFNLILRRLKRRRALLEAHCPLLEPLRALVSAYDTQFPGGFHPHIEAMPSAEDQARAANEAR